MQIAVSEDAFQALVRIGDQRHTQALLAHGGYGVTERRLRRDTESADFGYGLGTNSSGRYADNRLPFWDVGHDYSAGPDRAFTFDRDMVPDTGPQANEALFLDATTATHDGAGCDVGERADIAVVFDDGA